MQNAQVPLWVPLVVGVLGILGAIGAQWLSARRDDRRWEREQRREEQRWSREAADRQAQREHDARMQWRDHRLELYSAFLGELDVLGKLISWGKQRGREIPFKLDEQDDETKRVLDGVWQTYFRMALTGSPSLIPIARQAIAVHTRDLLDHVWHVGMTETDSSDAAMTPTESVRELRRRMREDLGVEITAAPNSFNPSPPSETTS